MCLRAVVSKVEFLTTHLWLHHQFCVLMSCCPTDEKLFSCADLCFCHAGRRTVLPATGTGNSHIGIMNILYNNIGKDLSRISMPVALNEPLSLLQRLSEELEYSELLDIANTIDDPYERMVSSFLRFLNCWRWHADEYKTMLVPRFTWQCSPSLDTPGRPGGIAINPSTLFWEKRTRVTEQTGASHSSVSR